MIQITPSIALHENEIQEEFIKASGPGGQHVNKAATAVQLRFDVANSPSLPEPVRERLARLAGNRLTGEGVLIIGAGQHRSQEQNRRDALNRLVQLIRQAAKRPKTRRRTKPSRAAKKRRLENKRRRGQVKRWRRSVDDSSW